MNNNAERFRRELLIRVIRGYLEGTLKKDIDRIPIELRPKTMETASRCCVYKDRAVTKYRLMAMLGCGVEEEVDEAKSLAEYLEDAENRTELSPNILSVLDIACQACIESQYIVTNACRGCFARPCTFTCPKGAITIVGRQAKIDKSKCIDCGKCTKVCPYGAIIRVPIPCEESCPVGAIKKDETGKEKIDFDKCISCGKCLKACPFSAVLERSQIIDILKAIKSGKEVVAMVAPSIIGQFPNRLEQIAEALSLAGFSEMEEVAFGAEKTTRNETAEFFEKMAAGDPIMTTSCCPAYVEAVKRHVPELLKYVSHTKSPMGYSAEMVKKRSPEAVTVFIGPCVAKRKEAQSDVNTDYVMTYEELGALFAALEINLSELHGITLLREADGYARGFATSCGVTSAILQDRAMTESTEKPNAKFINGLDKKSMKLLPLYANGKLPGNFLEVMACEGGCVGGPCSLRDVNLAALAVKKQIEEKK